MTRKHKLRKRRGTQWNSASSALANKVRWTLDRERRDAEEPERIREQAEWDVLNLPRKQGDALGCLQWTDFRTGKVRRWTVRIGTRCDRITVEAPGEAPSKSHGWTWFLTQLRKHLAGASRFG